MWPETKEALRQALADRPIAQNAADDGLAFLTKYGQPWAKETSDSPVTKEFRKILGRLGLHRPGLGFYALRHTFETIAGGCRDQVAVNRVMGRADSSMAGVDRERIDDRRLIDAANHVRAWLFRRTTPRP